MTPVTTEVLLEALNWRYATKKFDPSRKIAPEVWAALERALILAPSSYGLQPWKFVVVQDGATREKLSAASYGQRQPLDCSHLVVFSRRKNLSDKDIEDYIARMAEVREVPGDSLRGYASVLLGFAERSRKAGQLEAWTGHQVYIALGLFLASAALLGVDACPMEGIEGPKYDEILGLERLGFATQCVAAAGFRSADDKYAGARKVRFKASDTILHV